MIRHGVEKAGQGWHDTPVNVHTDTLGNVLLVIDSNPKQWLDLSPDAAATLGMRLIEAAKGKIRKIA